MSKFDRTPAMSDDSARNENMQNRLETLLKALGLAVSGGRYMIAVWRREDLRVHLWRATSNFPIDDLGVALTLLKSDVDAEKLRARRIIIPNSANSAKD